MLGSVLHGIAPASTWALELVKECNSPAVVHETREEVQYPNADLSDANQGVQFPNVASQTPSRIRCQHLSETRRVSPL